jgi:hypothetical protein
MSIALRRREEDPSTVLTAPGGNVNLGLRRVVGGITTIIVARDIVKVSRMRHLKYREERARRKKWTNSRKIEM